MARGRSAQAGGGGTKRKWLAVLMLVIGLILALGAYGYFKVTAEIETKEIDFGDALDLAEAKRKLNRLEGATRRQMRGYIRLLEPEINAYLAEKVRESTNSVPGVRHLRTAVNLGADFVTVHTWLEKKMLGATLPVVWQRTVQMRGTPSRPDFAITTMQVGELAAAPKHWEKLNEDLGRVDAVFEEELNLIKQLAALEIRPIDEGKGFEMRLYNYDPATMPENRPPGPAPAEGADQ